MNRASTYLSLGQRYIQSTDSAIWPDRQVVVAGFSQDQFGLPMVTFRCQNGREVTTYTEQIEIAVESGELFPVVGAGLVTRC